MLPVKSRSIAAKALAAASTAYYNSEEPVMSDQTFNQLEAAVYEPGTAPIGAPLPSGHQLITLPFFAASLEYIKTESEMLKFCRQFKEIVITEKLDGVSLLYFNDGTTDKLAVRGEGDAGGDVSFLIPILALPQIEDKLVAYRGELVLPKTADIGHYKSRLGAAVASVNSIDPPMEIIDQLMYVIYEARIIGQPRIPLFETQRLLAEKITSPKCHFVGYAPVDSSLVTEIAQLQSTLTDLRELSSYELDGIVLMGNIELPVNKVFKNGNPMYKMKFKMASDTNTAITTVIDVIGQPGMTGKVTPLIILDPFFINVIKITKTTGHNMDWVRARRIGKGAIVKIVHNVIPEIIEVISAGEPLTLAETVPKSEVFHLQLKNLFKVLGVVGAGPSMCSKLVALGYTDVGKILHVNSYDAENIGGAVGVKFVTSINKVMATANIQQIIGGLSMFGPGIGEKILMALPSDFIFNRPDFTVKIPGIGTQRLSQIESKYDDVVSQLKEWFSEDELITLSRFSATRD
jgi:NAD-dependent DNA ligase